MTSFFADSHPGHKRSHNEDCFEASPDLGLWLVADGVGGHADGEVAAAIVRDTLRNGVSAGENLVTAILNSHQAILQEISCREGSNMGSTVVALLLDNNAYDIAWVGDSRAYLYDSDLKQITRDHNPVSEMLARGAISPEQAAIHPERNVLSQSLGVSKSITVSPGHIRGELKAGQQILLCSDGLTDELDDARIAAIMSSHSNPAEQVSALIQGALDAGGRDNVTVVVVGNKPGKRDKKKLSDAKHITLGDEQAVGDPSPDGKSHDSKVLLLLGAMGALAVLWVALRIF